MLQNLYQYLFVDDLIAAPVHSPRTVRLPLKRRLFRDMAPFVLFSYLFFAFNPLMSMLADKMAHAFWEEYHIVMVHGIYGNNHLHMDMEKGAGQADKNKSQKTIPDDFSHIVPCITCNFATTYLVSSHCSRYLLGMTVSHPDIHYQPPRV